MRSVSFWSVFKILWYVVDGLILMTPVWMLLSFVVTILTTRG